MKSSNRTPHDTERRDSGALSRAGRAQSSAEERSTAGDCHSTPRSERESVYLDQIDLEWLVRHRPEVLVEIVKQHAAAAAASAERARCVGILRATPDLTLQRIAIQMDLTPSETSVLARSPASVA